MESSNAGLIVFIGAVMLLLGGIGGVLIGYEIGENNAENSVSELTDDKAAPEEAPVSLQDRAGACYDAVSLSSEALDNREEALAIDREVPWNASDAEWDAALDKIEALDNEFLRMAGRVNVAAAECTAANEAANQSVGAGEPPE